VGRIVVAIAATAVLCAQLQADPAEAAEPRANVDGELPKQLEEQIVTAIGETDRPVLNRFESRRRAREAAEAAIAVLRSEGYYAYEVEPLVGEGDAPQPVVRVAPGRRFNLQGAGVDWLGAPPPAEVAQAGIAAMGLPDGEPGRAADVLAAEGRVVAVVQQRGYADVAAEPREVIVDHADYSVRPTFKIVAGQLVRLNGLDMPRGGRTSRRWLMNLTPWRPGDVYDPEDVAELERRLLDTGAYDSVTVSLAPKEKTTPEGLRPVIVNLADRERRTIEAGASYATTEGLGVEVKWTRYNRLRRADSLTITGRLSQRDSRLGAEVAFPHWRRPNYTLRLGGAGYRVQTDAYDETGAGVRADITRRKGASATSYLTVGASLDFSRTDETRETTLTSRGRDVITAGLLGDIAIDRSNDPLNPTRGWRVSGRAEPTMLLGDVNRPYLKLVTQGSYYLPLASEGRTVVAARARAGLIVGGAIPEVPASRRFYAGGGGSVRGYSYQAVGPRLADNTPQGGLSLLEASLEVRQHVTGPWGVVAFVDAGSVGSKELPKGRDLSLGAGLGVRYHLAFAPIRVDLAVPMDRRPGDSAYQIYVSIGQSF
jgi:translocation and assembly module TamA